MEAPSNSPISQEIRPLPTLSPTQSSASLPPPYTAEAPPENLLMNTPSHISNHASLSQQLDSIISECSPPTLLITGTIISVTSPLAMSLYQTSTPLHNRGQELRIRRLLPSSKSIKFLCSNFTEIPPPPLDFDKDQTMYTITKAPMEPLVMELRGQRKSSLRGYVRMEWHMSCWKIWHVRKRSINNGKEHRTLLFRINWNPFSLKHWTSLTWKDGEGRPVAVETREVEAERDSRPVLRFLDGDLDAQVQDVLVACWCARVWFFASQIQRGEVKETVSMRLRLGKEVYKGRA